MNLVTCTVLNFTEESKTIATFLGENDEKIISCGES